MPSTQRPGRRGPGVRYTAATGHRAPGRGPGSAVTAGQSRFPAGSGYVHGRVGTH